MIKDRLNQPGVPDAIEEAALKMCHKLPGLAGKACGKAVRAYVKKAIAAFVILPSESTCAGMHMCPKEGPLVLSDLTEMFASIFPESETEEDSANPACVACKAGIKAIKKVLTGEKMQERLVAILDEACSHAGEK